MAKVEDIPENVDVCLRVCCVYINSILILY